MNECLRAYAHAGTGVLCSSALAQAPGLVLLARLALSVSSVASRRPLLQQALRLYECVIQRGQVANSAYPSTP